ncbi:MAG: type II toxin-antitoxin system RelE/ParE family toxin [Sphingomonas sp.]|jgi:plasmid stabilization system protein ParE|uniref:type II toxin-antitoxin system RelE/ParE family toxin n=1 Tax=Sphingomonas sp. TaxID=28214 RepID=UPI0035684ECF
MLDLRITGDAGDDLDTIWRYTRERYGGDAADTYLRGFNELFVLLRERPEAGAVVPGVRPETRSFGYRRHRAYYRITEHRVEIVRIAHKAQNAGLFFD